MNAISKRSGSAQPEIISAIPDAMPIGWDEKVHTVWSFGPHSAAIQRQAREALHRLEPFAMPVPDGTVRKWLLPLVAAVPNPKVGNDMNAYVAALMMAVGDLPIGAFNQQTQRVLLRECRMWPAVSEVYGVVAPVAFGLRQDIAALKRVVSAATKAEGPI